MPNIDDLLTVFQLLARAGVPFAGEKVDKSKYLSSVASQIGLLPFFFPFFSSNKKAALYSWQNHAVLDK